MTEKSRSVFSVRRLLDAGNGNGNGKQPQTSMSTYFWPFSFLIVALALLVLELFLPSGGLLGLVAVLCLVSGTVSAFLQIGSGGGALYLLICTIFFPIVISLALKIWPKTPMGRRLLIEPRGDDDLIPQRQLELQQMVGKTGVAISAMLPSGALRVDGRLMDAVSNGTTIDQGTTVEIIDVRGNHLVVRPRADLPTHDPDSNSDEGGLDKVIPDPFEDPLT